MTAAPAPVDDVVVTAVCAGRRDPATVTPRERAEAVRRLNRSGHTDPDISHLTGISVRTVTRIRRRIGLPPAVTATTRHNPRRARPPLTATELRARRVVAALARDADDTRHLLDVLDLLDTPAAVVGSAAAS